MIHDSKRVAASGSLFIAVSQSDLRRRGDERIEAPCSAGSSTCGGVEDCSQTGRERRANSLKRLARPAGLEPATSWFVALRLPVRSGLLLRIAQCFVESVSLP